MKLKIIVLALTFVSGLNAQKMTKIFGKDSTRFLRDGKSYKVPGHRMEIEGCYNGKDLYIRNSYGPGDVGFCITGLKVNGNYTTDEINATIFKVDLGQHKMKIGDPVKIVIYYKDSCSVKEPLMMNSSVIKPMNSSKENSLIVEGTNYNASMHVVNSRTKNGFGIKEILVNGRKVESIEKDVIEISFFKMGIPYQDKLKIEFKFENGFDPFIIDPEVINY